jgi:hypothetical protein
MSAFFECPKLEKAAFRASLIIIDANAFEDCKGLVQVTFAIGSQLQYIRSGAFSKCPLKRVVVPAHIMEIDPSAFSIDVWRKCLTFAGPPLFLIDRHFIRSLDSRVVFRSLSETTKLLIGSDTEVMTINAGSGSLASRASALFRSLWSATKTVIKSNTEGRSLRETYEIEGDWLEGVRLCSIESVQCSSISGNSR